MASSKVVFAVVRARSAEANLGQARGEELGEDQGGKGSKEEGAKMLSKRCKDLADFDKEWHQSQVQS